MRLPIFPRGARGDPLCPSTLSLIERLRYSPSPSASSAVHTEIKTMSSVSANMVLISLVRAGAPTLHGGSAPKPARDLDKPSRGPRNTTTLTVRRPRFCFRDTDPELQVSRLLCGRLYWKKATRKSRRLKRALRPGLARVGSSVPWEDGGVGVCSSQVARLLRH